MRTHWNAQDFVVTATSPAYDGSDAVNEFGYCRVCKADMQRFAGSKVIRHYHSHQRAKRLGLWGK